MKLAAIELTKPGLPALYRVIDTDDVDGILIAWIDEHGPREACFRLSDNNCEWLYESDVIV